jgi:hypothetical protein
MTFVHSAAQPGAALVLALTAAGDTASTGQCRQKYRQLWPKTREITDAFREVKARKSPLECGLEGISGML